MTYQEVIDMFRDVTTQVAQNFVHGKIPDVNFFTINTEWPLVILPPFRDVSDYEKANIERAIVLLFFAQDNPNNTMEDREAIISAQYSNKEEFINYFREQFESPSSPYFGLSISKVVATPEYAQMAGYASGYSVTFTLKSKIKCS
jgi:hypothetical protein